MNRLREASYNASRERYTYDMVGNRLKKETEQGQEIYTYNTDSMWEYPDPQGSSLSLTAQSIQPYRTSVTLSLEGRNVGTAEMYF